MFIDTHAHLYDEKFDGRAGDFVKRANDMGVDKIICSGSDFQTSLKAVSLAEKYQCVYACVGVHPQDAESFSDKTLNDLKDLAKHEKVVAIGEIGLEYLEDSPDRDLQKKVFKQQIDLAKQLDMPIVIHCRQAVGDALEILKPYKSIVGTFHCFSESLESAKIILGLGLHISIGGVVTFKNGKKLQEVVPHLPLNRILLETDCPYLAPHPYRGSLNEPANIPLIAEKIAELKEISVEELAKATTENARRLFKI